MYIYIYVYVLIYNDDANNCTVICIYVSVCVCASVIFGGNYIKRKLPVESYVILQFHLEPHGAPTNSELRTHVSLLKKSKHEQNISDRYTKFIFEVCSIE